MSFIFMNFFVAILNDSFEDVKSNTDKQSKEFEMADFILERVCDMLGISKRGKDAGQNASVREDDAASTNSLSNRSGTKFISYQVYMRDNLTCKSKYLCPFLSFSRLPSLLKRIHIALSIVVRYTF